MSVDVKFTQVAPNEAIENGGRYEDGEGREYRYVIGDSGVLLIFEKELDKRLTRDAEPIAVYGPHAWFSVTGDTRAKGDLVAGRMAGF